MITTSSFPTVSLPSAVTSVCSGSTGTTGLGMTGFAMADLGTWAHRARPSVANHNSIAAAAVLPEYAGNAVDAKQAAPPRGRPR